LRSAASRAGAPSSTSRTKTPGKPSLNFRSHHPNAVTDRLTSTPSLNFSFKCHRDTPQGSITNVYAVNDISFHPQHGTFSTAGSDGTFHFWDKDAKHRLKGYPNVGGSITATTFNKTGSIFAYAISYDWAKGYQGNTANYPTKVMLHPVQPDECKPRPSVKKR
jgi:mRNA export factor